MHEIYGIPVLETLFIDQIYTNNIIKNGIFAGYDYCIIC
jgi:hypothetical protein